MSQNERNIVLSWQAPVGRVPQHRIAARLDKISKPSRGFLGVLRSPSIAGPASLPDPIELAATVVFAPDGFDANKLTITAPAAYLPALVPEDYVALSVVPDAICVCIEKVPTEIVRAGSASIEAWLAKWPACTEQP